MLYKLPKYIIKWIIKYHCLGLTRKDKKLKNEEIRACSENDFLLYIPHPDQIGHVLHEQDCIKYKNWFKSNCIYLFEQDYSTFVLPRWSYCNTWQG